LHEQRCRLRHHVLEATQVAAEAVVREPVSVISRVLGELARDLGDSVGLD
jgi:hypothetical protein